MKSRLYEKYKNEVRPALREKRTYANVHQVPEIEKIVVNMGVSASLEKGAVDDAAKDLTLITGRKPVISRSRKSIANFKLRENQPIGCRVTLRRDEMYEFFDRLVATALRKGFTDTGLLWLNRGAGIVILGFGLVALISLLPLPWRHIRHAIGL